MANKRSELALRDDLKRAFQIELERLASATSRHNPVEGVMRLRALSEIASVLDTTALLNLAVTIEAEHGVVLKDSR